MLNISSLNIYYFSSIFEGIYQNLSNSLLLFIKTGPINRIRLGRFLQNTSLYAYRMFLVQLFLVICSSIFLQSKGRKRKSLWRKNTKSFVLCCTIIIIHKETVGKKSTPSLLQKEKVRSAKSADSKCCFQTGKIKNPKVRLRKEELCNLCVAINSNLLGKTRTQDKVKCHIQQKGS